MIEIIQNLKLTKNKRLSTTSCKINTIQVNEGSTNPIMIYSATSDGVIYRIMAIPEELNQKFQLQNLRKSSDILLEDKQNKFYFYSENNNNSENFKKLNLAGACQPLNQQIISQKEYQPNGKYANLRISNNLYFK